MKSEKSSCPRMSPHCSHAPVARVRVRCVAASFAPARVRGRWHEPYERMDAFARRFCASLCFCFPTRCACYSEGLETCASNHNFPAAARASPLTPRVFACRCYFAEAFFSPMPFARNKNANRVAAALDREAKKREATVTAPIGSRAQSSMSGVAGGGRHARKALSPGVRSIPRRSGAPATLWPALERLFASPCALSPLTPRVFAPQYHSA